jgi:hypothetical protein
MSQLILAESYLRQGGVGECERCLDGIDLIDPTSEFFTLGNIHRIRGLCALEVGASDDAAHHFNRSRTIFQNASDLFHTANADILIGANLARDQRAAAIVHVKSAMNVFRSLGATFSEREASAKLRELDPDWDPSMDAGSTLSEANN